MSGVSKEQIEQAKKVDLLAYLQTYEPDNLIKISANEYCLKDHDSLKISNGMFHWFSRNIGGVSALDFLIKVRGMDFVNTVMVLCNQRAPPVVSSFQTVNEQSQQKSEFVLPTPNWNNAKVTAYLLKRGIDGEIIEKCIRDGILYQTQKYGNCCFVGRDNSGIPRFACVRSTINNLRYDIEESDKKHSFNILSTNPQSGLLFVTESAIDTLSAMTLRKICGKTYENCNYLSLDGTSTIPLIQYLDNNPHISHIILGLDNDSAGRKCEDKIKEVTQTDVTLKNRHISVISEPPTGENCKDYNDMLLAVIQKPKEHTKVRSNADIFI